MCQRTGRPPISIIGFGFTVVSSEMRVPNPPAKMMTSMDRLGHSIQGIYSDKSIGQTPAKSSSRPIITSLPTRLTTFWPSTVYSAAKKKATWIILDLPARFQSKRSADGSGLLANSLDRIQQFIATRVQWHDLAALPRPTEKHSNDLHAVSQCAYQFRGSYA